MFDYPALKREFQKQGPNLQFSEPIELDMENLPEGIESISIKYSALLPGTALKSDNLKTFPKGFTLSVCDDVRLPGLQSIADDVYVYAYGNFECESLESIGDDFYIDANNFYAENAKNVGNRVTISAAHSVNLESLLHMGDNVSISAKCGFVNLKAIQSTGCNVYVYANGLIMMDNVPPENTNVVFHATWH